MMARHAQMPVALTLAVLLAACADSAPTPSRVRIGTDVDAETLDPRLNRNTTGYRVVDLLYDGLVRLDSAFEAMPALAESWEHPNDTVWVFQLRETARFHDGTPLRAADVVHTFETILDPALNAPQRRLYTPIRRVNALDDYRVQFTLREPYAPFLKYLEMGIVPEHLVESGHDLGNRPVGSGPYRLVRWNKGSRIILEANSDYWAGSPNIEQIDIVVVPDNTARAQAFEAGDLDLIQSPLAPQDVQRLATQERFDHRIQLGIAVTYLNFNTTVPRLADSRMRRALSMLVDQQTVIDQIYERMDHAATSLLIPASWAYSEQIVQPAYDPLAAERLLDELGWRDSNDDGVRDRNRTRLRLRLGTHSEDVNRVQTVEFLQNTFQRHGVETEVEISDWASFSVRRDAGDYEIILLGWTQIIDPDRVMFEQLHSEGGLNWGSYSNPSLDSLLELGRTLANREERARTYQRAARIIAEDVPYYVLSYQGYQAFWNPRIAGFEPNPRGLVRSLARARIEE